MSCYGANLIVPDGQCTDLEIIDFSFGGHYQFNLQTCMTGFSEHGSCIKGNTSTVSVWVHL